MIKNILAIGLLIMKSSAENEVPKFVQPHESNIKLEKSDSQNTLYRIADYNINDKGVIIGRAEMTKFTYKTLTSGYFNLETRKIPV
jgi:hypothetical protein